MYWVYICYSAVKEYFNLFASRAIGLGFFVLIFHFFEAIFWSSMLLISGYDTFTFLDDVGWKYQQNSVSQISILKITLKMKI